MQFLWWEPSPEIESSRPAPGVADVAGPMRPWSEAALSEGGTSVHRKPFRVMLVVVALMLAGARVALAGASRPGINQGIWTGKTSTASAPIPPPTAVANPSVPGATYHVLWVRDSGGHVTQTISRS